MCDSSSATRIVFSSMAESFSRRRTKSGGRLLLVHLQLKPERASLTQLTADIDPAVVRHFDDVAGEREAETCSASDLPVGFHAAELVEHEGQVSRRDACAGVGHFDPESAGGLV